MIVSDFLTWMLRESGVVADGQVPNARDIVDAFNRANVMLGQWQRKRWMVYHLVDRFCTSTGQIDYTVGPGQQFNIGYRPERIYSGFFRQFPQLGATPDTPGPPVSYTYYCQVRDHYHPSITSNIVKLVLTTPYVPPEPLPSGVGQPVDYPLNIIRARENYSVINLKSLVSWPQSVFLDTGWPIGYAKFYPVPAAGQFELHLQFGEVLQKFINLSDEIAFPPEYEAALLYNLVVRTRAAYGLQADPVMVGLAKDGLDTVREASLQIPNMYMPPELIRDGRYNIYSDNVDK